MKNQTKLLPKEGYPEMQARQAIEQITQWVDERYPALSALSKSRLITQCLIEVREERRNLTSLN